jgi:hypothetical protein
MLIFEKLKKSNLFILYGKLFRDKLFFLSNLLFFFCFFFYKIIKKLFFFFLNKLKIINLKKSLDQGDYWIMEFIRI